MKKKHFRRWLSLILAAGCISAAIVVNLPASAETSNAEVALNSYQVVSPVPTGSSIKPITQPSRLSTLEGKTIALVGGSFSASVTHKVISDMLEQEYHCKTYYMTDEVGKSGTFNPNNISDKSEEFMENLKKYKIDAVISGNCGCGICTVKETGNGLAAEYAGIPAVVVGAEAFVPQIESTGYNRGVPVVRTAAYPGAFANDTTETQEKKAREILYPQIVTALTTQITQAEIDRIAGAVGSVNYDDIVFTGSFERCQQFYEVYEMSDGLTVVPPTREKVEYYLQFTPYSATDIINTDKRTGEVQDVPPANKKIMAYHVAANAIMSGCPPEYMPLCIAIVKCFANGNFYKSLASTHSWTPYVLISGPIARQLGFSYEDGMINKEANKLLGRFISLAMLNLAGYKIKENRMGTFGYLQPFAFAEDEQTCINIGWNPYHVEKGYDLNDNVITCGSTLTWGNPIEIGTTDPDKAIELLAWDVTEKQQNGLGNTNPREARMIWLTKDAAETISKGSSSKSGLEQTLIQTARRSLWMRTYAHYWANTGSKIHMNTTFDAHYDAIKNGASTENVESDYVSSTDVPSWLEGIVPFDKIDTTQTISENNTGFVITGGDVSSQIQVMPGGDCCSVKVELPGSKNSVKKWNELTAANYAPIDSFNLSK